MVVVMTRHEAKNVTIREGIKVFMVVVIPKFTMNPIVNARRDGDIYGCDHSKTYNEEHCHDVVGLKVKSG